MSASFTATTPPVLVDWMPWNHCFGGNHDFNLVLACGGTLYVDGGRPAPGLIEQTVRNLAEVSPTIYLNVPAGYNALLPYLERDAELAARVRSVLRRYADAWFQAAKRRSRDESAGCLDRYGAVEPANVGHTLEVLAETRGERLEVLARVIDENATAAFGLP
jgi:acyl-CoA synthetase (AMP-forming)/AMP-acid ligase II